MARVNDYLQRARVGGVELAVAVDHLTTRRWSDCCSRRPVASRVGAGLSPIGPIVDQEMRRPGVTLALLWEEYRAEHPDGFGYSWFCEHYAALEGARVARPCARRHVRRREGVRRFRRGHHRHHRPRDRRSAADEALRRRPGRLNLRLRAKRGRARGLADWIGCARRPLRLPRRRRRSSSSATTSRRPSPSPDRYEPGDQPQLPRHGTTITAPAIVPARPYKPRDKAKVEQSVLTRRTLGFGPAAASALLQRRPISTAPSATSSATLNARIMTRLLGASRRRAVRDTSTRQR